MKEAGYVTMLHKCVRSRRELVAPEIGRTQKIYSWRFERRHDVVTGVICESPKHLRCRGADHRQPSHPTLPATAKTCVAVTGAGQSRHRRRGAFKGGGRGV